MAVVWTSSSFQPVKEMGFQNLEIKFPATVDCLDVKEKTGQVLRKTLIRDPRCWTLFEGGGHNRLTWPMFDIILFFTS